MSDYITFGRPMIFPTRFDFLRVSATPTKQGFYELKPKFVACSPSKHLMIRGGDFYAIWIEEKGLWSTNEQDVIDIIDRELDKCAKEHEDKFGGVPCRILYIWDTDTGMIDKLHKYVKQQMRDSFHPLDEKIIFSNTETTRTDYASKRLNYPLEEGDTSAWDKLIGTLYSDPERKKIEWSIGSIVHGDSRELQKFMVFYGAAGTGKSTVIGIIEKLFEGYTATFNSKALGQSNNQFALEPFKNNPLVGIEHDGDLSHIEDNTVLNSLVSHERMSVNEKFAKMYENTFKCFLFVGTNRPVRITDAKSGLLRRLIDVTPTGNTVKPSEYKRLVKQIGFEYGAIAKHCLDVYLEDPGAYNDYVPVSMLAASNDFYNFITYPDVWDVFFKERNTTATIAWTMYKKYCDDAKVQYPYSLRPFKEELKNYFEEFYDRYALEDGTRVRSYYKGFRVDKFEDAPKEKEPEKHEDISWIHLAEQPSVFDRLYFDCPAQYANEDDKPLYKWENVKLTLKDIDTSRVHYVKPPRNLIVIDLDIPDENGVKDLERNLKEAAKWPETYAEVSKSGKAVHLHYIYEGDVSKLNSLYADHVEIKTFTGGRSLRRKLTLCNDLPVKTITGGLPLKEEKKIVNFDSVMSEKKLIELVQRCMLDKKDPMRINPEGTKPAVDFIFKLLEDAYANDKMSYDLTCMRNSIYGFALKSTNQKETCLKLVDKMHFQSKDKEDIPVEKPDLDSPNIYYDVEVLPNYFLLNYKIAENYTPDDFPKWKDYIKELQTNHKPVVRMICPTAVQVEEFLRKFGNQWVDFNGLRYDRHIIHGRIMGFDNARTYNLSRRIISGDKDALSNEAKKYGRTDVYDFASAGNKKSLKKLEIEMGFTHKEFNWPWDEPLPEELWTKVAEYCDNDVLATEAAFHYLKPDWIARQILADITDMTVNDTTNSLTTRFIFGSERHPQSHFLYRKLSEPVFSLPPDVLKFLKETCPEMMASPHGEAKSLLPYFPGYVKEKGISTYRGEEVGEGGYVYAEPGIHTNVALLDVASMHPHSLIAECLFGVLYTIRFREIVEGRVYIKHEDWEHVAKILDGKLAKYIPKIQSGEITSKDLANALKTAINSVYGLTSASFENPFRDKRNIDNIVAKRGALFMVDLKHAVQEKGFTVAHIKTDSIKIPNATPEIIQFVMDFGKRYGYTFEHEATYDRMCLVNDAVYIARYDTAENCMARYGYIPGDVKKHPGEWTATGKQFQVPYVFKTLFSHEPIEFKDMCEVFSVDGALYLDMNEKLEDPFGPEEEWAKRLYNATRPDKPKRLNPAYDGISDSELQDIITKCHDYHFVGKVGQFTPIKPGCGGGLLMRKADDRYSSATGAKGFRWMESEMVKDLGYENNIDRTYYDNLVNKAVEAISKYDDFEWFTSN